MKESKETAPQKKSQRRHFPDRRRKRRKIPYQNKYKARAIKKRQENKAENNLNLPTATSTAAEQQRTTNNTAPLSAPRRTTPHFPLPTFSALLLGVLFVQFLRSV